MTKHCQVNAILKIFFSTTAKKWTECFKRISVFIFVFFFDIKHIGRKIFMKCSSCFILAVGLLLVWIGKDENHLKLQPTNRPDWTIQCQTNVHGNVQESFTLSFWFRYLLVKHLSINLTVILVIVFFSLKRFFNV